MYESGGAARSSLKAVYAPKWRLPRAAGSPSGPRARPEPAVPYGGRGIDRGSNRQRRARVLGPVKAVGKVGSMQGRRASLFDRRSLATQFCHVFFSGRGG